MKLQIFQESAPEPEKTIILRLVPLSGDHVELQVVDKKGSVVPGGHILCILPHKPCILYTSISEDFGFALDEKGRLKFL